MRKPTISIANLSNGVFSDLIVTEVFASVPELRIPILTRSPSLLPSNNSRLVSPAMFCRFRVAAGNSLSMSVTTSSARLFFPSHKLRSVPFTDWRVFQPLGIEVLPPPSFARA